MKSIFISQLLVVVAASFVANVWACSSSKSNDPAATPTPDPSPDSDEPEAPIELTYCPKEAPTEFPMGVVVSGQIETSQISQSCTSQSDGLGGLQQASSTSGDTTKSAYNIVCDQRTTENKRLSFWLNEPSGAGTFGVKDSWQMVPNISFQYVQGSGASTLKLDQDSFGKRTNLKLLNTVIYTLNTSAGVSANQKKQHLVKGCVEIEFDSATTSSNKGYLKVLYNVLLESNESN